MKISEETINFLSADWYLVYYDDFLNEVALQEATKLHLCSKGGDYFLKTIKAIKSEMSIDYIISKLGDTSTYKNFVKNFKTLLPEEMRNNLVCYAASYGIGILVCAGIRSRIENVKQEIKDILNKKGIEYSTEYSDAHWIFRYKISKSKENIERMTNG